MLQIVRVGPVSAGYKISEEGMVFQADGEGNSGTLTATDIAVAAGLAEVGNKENVRHLAPELVSMASQRIHQLLDDAIDKVKVRMVAFSTNFLINAVISLIIYKYEHWIYHNGFISLVTLDRITRTLGV